MTTTIPEARPATATRLTFAANPAGRFPPVLTEDGGWVTAPAGGAPMLVIDRYEDLLSVKSSPAWRMANRCETPLTGAEIPGGEPAGHMLGMDGVPHRKLRLTIGHLFTRHAADTLRPQMRRTAGALLDRLAVGGTGDLRADYAEPATAVAVCAALGIPVADWAPVIRPAGEVAFGVVRSGTGLAASHAAWDGIWAYYRRMIAAKRASPDGLVAQMYLAMNRAGYSTEEIVRAVATVSNGATALLPVLERALLWLLQHPGVVVEVSLGKRAWLPVIREAMVRGALFPVTPPLVAGPDARIGERPVPDGTLVLPSLASAVNHPRGGAWLAFGSGQHRCPGDGLTFAAVVEYAGAFFRRYPGACLATPVLTWRDGPLATPREALFAVRQLPRPGAAATLPAASLPRPRLRGSAGLARSAGGLPPACGHTGPHGDVRNMRLPSDDLVWGLCRGHRAPSRWQPSIAAHCRRSTATCWHGAAARWWPMT